MTLALRRLLLLGGILLAWQAMLSLDLFGLRGWSTPWTIALRLTELFASGEIFPHLLDSTAATLIALFLSMAGGTGLGLLLARYRMLAAVLNPLLVAIYGVPRIAFAPMIILFFGVSITAKVVLAVSIVLFVFTANVHEGARRVDPVLLKQLRLMGATPVQLFRLVTLPALVPWIWAAFDLGLGLSFIGVIIAELVSSTRGLGHLIARSAMGFDNTGVYALLVVVMVLTLLFRATADQLRRKLVPWART